MDPISLSAPRILSRRPRRDRPTPGAHCLNGPNEGAAVDAVAITNDMVWRFPLAAGFGQLTQSIGRAVRARASSPAQPFGTRPILFGGFAPLPVGHAAKGWPSSIADSLFRFATGAQGRWLVKLVLEGGVPRLPNVRRRFAPSALAGSVIDY